MKKFTAIILTFVFYAANAQKTDRDSIKIANPPAAKSNPLDGFRTIRATKIKITSLILPAAAIAYGFVSLENDELKKLNSNTKLEITEDHPRPVTKLDNYLQYSPAVAVYALNAFGIKGKNNFRDRTIILGLSTVITTAITVPLKHITKEQRPDGSDFYSFPSGHTATAFAAAEFLRQEYKDVSPWYGVAGYTAAAVTGILRLYNNKHWVSDVVAGAGIGIISTKLTYWIYPSIKRKLFKNKPMNTIIMPFYQPGGGGIAMVYRFRH